MIYIMQALIPQLAYPLKADPMTAPSVELQLSSLRALEILITECAPCMPRWKGAIIDGVGRCWVALKDSGSSTRKYGLDSVSP